MSCSSQTSYFAKARQKISPIECRAQKEIPTGNQSQNVNLSLNWNQTLLLISFFRQSRCVQLGSFIRVNHRRRFRLHWNLIHPMRNVTLLNQRHARNLWGVCSYKGDSRQACVEVWTYGATPFFSAKRTPLRMLSWKIIFLGSLAGFHSTRKILTCLFAFLLFLLNFL